MIETTREVRQAALPIPSAPRSLEEAGLRLDFVTQLALKTLFFAGELSGAELARRLGVIFSIVQPSLEFLKAQRHCEIVSGAMVGGSSYRYRLTTEGRAVAATFLQQNQYVGVAPVPLAQYASYMAAIGKQDDDAVSQLDVRDAYSHLILSDAVLDQIGPAVNGGQSIFIYGPPGNGKTAIALALRHLLKGDIAVPHAIEVEGSIVRVFDPVSHEEVPPREDLGISVDVSLDRRWSVCRRPAVLAGGELTLEALDLTFDARLGYYRAPVQLIANGGVLVVDDFGRQRCQPRDLLNRWMVPLENGVDFLTLQSGLKFQVPFLAFVAFATNVSPAELVDEAFLRRVRYKVFAHDPSSTQFAQIFEVCCQARGIPFDPALVDRLLDGYYHEHGLALRACHPRDLITQALLLAHYRGQPRELTGELLDAACAGYFVDERR